MKQNITVEQLDELSNKAFKKLNKWVFRDIVSNPYNLRIKGKRGRYYMVAEEKDYFLSIGQLIEFLMDNNYFPGEYHIDSGICNELWETVKEKLEE